MKMKCTPRPISGRNQNFEVVFPIQTPGGGVSDVLKLLELTMDFIDLVWLIPRYILPIFNEIINPNIPSLENRK
jgi:hypothetical protein